MADPEALGDFESLETLAPTLKPIYREEIGSRFLAWDVANSKAWGAGEKQTELPMAGQRYYQKTFKYPAHTFEILKEKFALAKASETLLQFLTETDCLRYLEET